MAERWGGRLLRVQRSLTQHRQARGTHYRRSCRSRAGMAGCCGDRGPTAWAEPQRRASAPLLSTRVESGDGLRVWTRRRRPRAAPRRCHARSHPPRTAVLASEGLASRSATPASTVATGRRRPTSCVSSVRHSTRRRIVDIPSARRPTGTRLVPLSTSWLATLPWGAGLSQYMELAGDEAAGRLRGGRWLFAKDRLGDVRISSGRAAGGGGPVRDRPDDRVSGSRRRRSDDPLATLTPPRARGARADGPAAPTRHIADNAGAQPPRGEKYVSSIFGSSPCRPRELIAALCSRAVVSSALTPIGKKTAPVTAVSRLSPLSPPHRAGGG